MVMKKKKITLSTAVLDSVWSDWLSEHKKVSFADQIRQTQYRYYTGYGNLQDEFRLWLQHHGAVIRKDHYVHILEFQNPEHATFFILKYT